MMTPGRRYSRVEGILLLASAFALIPMLATDAAGLQVDMVPSARIEEGWVSNVNNSSTGEVSSLTTRATPALALRFTTSDGVEMKLTGNYEKVWYHNSEASQPNTDTFHFRVDTTGELRLTPNFSMVPSVSYINTTNSFRRTELVPSGDPVVPPVTITNYGDRKTETIGAGVRFDYRMTQNTTLGVNGNYSRQRFDIPVDNALQTGLTDSSSFGAGTSVSYLFTPLTKMGVKLSGSHNTFEDNPDSNTVSGQVIFDHLFSPSLRFEGGVGVQHLRRSATQEAAERSSTTPTGTVNLSYKQESFTATLYGSWVYSGTSGFGGDTRQLTAGMRLLDKFARDWAWNLSGTYQVNRSVFDTDAVNIHTISGATGFQYNPWRWASLDLTGHATRQTSSARFGQDLNSYSAYLGMTASHPFNLY